MPIRRWWRERSGAPCSATSPPSARSPSTCCCSAGPSGTAAPGPDGGLCAAVAGAAGNRRIAGMNAEASGTDGVLPEATSHVIWDWNGTLLDDVGAVLEATTVAFRQAGIDVAVTGETYRRSFTRPIHLFYERLLGRPIGHDEWVRLDHAFHLEYARLDDRCTLAAGAREVLDEIRELGWSQSVCS